jgi:DNA-binding HxlR family transcriptional regulator
MALFDLIGRRWNLRIIWELRQAPRPLTFRELRSACGDISSSVLTQRLRELSDVRITAHAGDGYTLTSTGIRLVAALQPVLDWSRAWNQELTAADEDKPPIVGHQRESLAKARTIDRFDTIYGGVNSPN